MERRRYAVEYEPSKAGGPGRLGVGALGSEEGCGYAVVALGQGSAIVEVRAGAEAAARLEADGACLLLEAGGEPSGSAEGLAAWLEAHGVDAREVAREASAEALSTRGGLRSALCRLYGVDRRAMDEAGVG